MRTSSKIWSVKLAGRSSKILSINTAASRELIGYSEVDIYEKGQVMAIRAVRRGRYFLAFEKGRDRAVICNLELVKHLREKYACEDAVHFAAWAGPQKGVLFFSVRPPEDETAALDDTWKRVELEYHPRAGEWAYVHDNWTEFTKNIRTALSERMSLYQAGRITVLCPDPAGPLVSEARRRSQRRMLTSPALAHYLQETYGMTEGRGMRLRAAVDDAGRVRLSDDRDALLEPLLGDLTPVELDESPWRFLSATPKYGFYLSADAWRALGEEERLGVYACGQWLALAPESRTGVPVTTCGYSRCLFSTVLTGCVKLLYPDESKLYLFPHGRLWLLQTRPVRTETPPPPEYFLRLDLTPGAANAHPDGWPPKTLAEKEKGEAGRNRPAE